MKSLTDTPESMQKLILSVFHAIALLFQPSAYSSTEEVLQAALAPIVERIAKRELMQLSNDVDARICTMSERLNNNQQDEADTNTRVVVSVDEDTNTLWF